MKPSELKDKSVDELVELEKTTARDLWQSKFSNYSNQLDDTAKIRRLRRDVARVKTALTQKRSTGK
ncbi:MAG: 50S ribosomal protein L29 [Deltaproteobacteria bacterium]|nr:50S ribosomal protein L29 [Deltaproteobacteria bacterium]